MDTRFGDWIVLQNHHPYYGFLGQNFLIDSRFTELQYKRPMDILDLLIGRECNDTALRMLEKAVQDWNMDEYQVKQFIMNLKRWRNIKDSYKDL